MLMFFIACLIILFQSNIASSVDKEKVFEQLRAKFSNISSLRIQFQIVSSPTSGNLLVTRGNKFRLELKSQGKTERLIVSNGTTVWNYSIAEHQVVISNVGESENYDLQNIFANLSNQFTPISLARENVSFLGSNLVLELESKKDAKDRVKIYLDKKMEIRAISFGNEGNTIIYQIKKLQLDPKAQPKQFEFTPPKDAQIIDLR